MLLANEFETFKRNCDFYFSRILNEPLIMPDMLQIDVTHRCNLRCKMCNIWACPRKEFSTSEIKRLIDEAYHWGIGELYLVGGEPTVRSDILKIINYAGKRGIKTIITTNGVLLSEKKFAEKIVASSLNYLSFSLDGANAKTHDCLRGKGVFNKVIRAINLVNKLKEERGLKKEDYPFLAINTIIWNLNLEEIIDLVHLAEKLNVNGIAFQPILVNNMVLTEKDFNHFAWIPKESLPVLDKIMDKLYAYQQKKGFVQVDTALMKKYFRNELSFKEMKCFAGFNRIFVDIEGGVGTPCMTALGNIRENSLKKCWHSKEAWKMRVEIKNCKNPCLQLAATKSESENLTKIFLNFMISVNQINDNAEKTRIIKQILILFEKYNNLLYFTKSQMEFFHRYGKEQACLTTKEYIEEINNVIDEIGIVKENLKKPNDCNE